LPRQVAHSRIALICAVALAAALAGCKNSAQVFEDQNDGGWFSKSVDVFAKPEWAKTNDSKVGDLGPKGPVGPEDLVSADGSCAAAAAPQVAAPQPAAADRPVGSVAGDLAAAPQPAGAGEPQVLGGIALGMTECQAVHRAGTPSNVTIGAGNGGGRKVVLTYLTGTWPGIYHFADGRLQEIDRAPAPPASPKAPAKKKPGKKPAKPQTVVQ
jgi:hypothetical protein